jgi:hypothetical protein
MAKSPVDKFADIWFRATPFAMLPGIFIECSAAMGPHMPSVLFFLAPALCAGAWLVLGLVVVAVLTATIKQLERE